MKAYRKELNAAYSAYYAERHKLQDLDPSANEWEFPLWEKWEAVFISIHRKHFG